MKKKSLLIHFQEDEMEIYLALKEKSIKDKRTLPNTAKFILKEKLKKEVK